MDARRADVVPVSGGLHHKFHAEGGMTFMEAVVPVPLDDIPDKTADLVQHVAE